MNKAEERGKTYTLHKASEKLHDYYGNAMLSVVQFDGYDIKNSYIDGYSQAEKDLELTWKDIGIILKISSFVDEQHCDNNREFCKEVLKRFKNLKK